MNFRPSGPTQQSLVSAPLPMSNIRTINRPINGNLTHLAPRQAMNQLYLLPKGPVNQVQTTATYPNMVQMRQMPQQVNPVLRQPIANQTIVSGATSSSIGSGKLLAFFNQLLDLSKKTKKPEAHTGVANLIQQLVNREVNSQSFCTQLQVILKSDNGKTNICPFIESNIDSLRKDLYLGKLTLNNVQPPRKEMIEDLLNAPSSTSATTIQQNTNQTTISVNNSNLRIPTPTVLPNQQRFTTSTISTPTIMTTVCSNLMTTGIPIARFSPATTTSVNPVLQASSQHQQQHPPSIAPSLPSQHQNQTPQQRSIILSANNSARMLLSPQSTTPNGRLLTNIRPVIQNQPIAASSVSNTPHDRTQPVAPKNSSANGMSITNFHGARMITVPSDIHGPGSSVSTNDQPFFPTSTVKSKMESYLKENAPSDSLVISEDAAACLAHALHSFTKSLLIRLNIVVQHRSDRLIEDPRLKQVDAVRDQIGFLQRLDEHLMNRQSDLEKELILKAAKSRSKFEDPDQVKVREMAKRLANEDYEREKQHLANVTALSAIQGFKKRRLDQTGNQESSGDSSQSNQTPSSASALLAVKKNTANLKSSSLSNRLSIGSVKSLACDPNSLSDPSQFPNSSSHNPSSSVQNIRTLSSSAALRTKKACLKDLQFVLSKHNVLCKSRTLYKSYWH